MEHYQLKSMTAYGRGSSNFPYGRFTIEIQSVNRRYLEINLALPRIFMRFEIDIRKQIAESVGRGMLTLSLFWKTEGAQPVTVTPNLSLARALKDAWEKLASELGMEKSLPPVLVAQQQDLLLHEEEIIHEEIYRAAFHAALKEALEALLVMKRQEGAALAQDLQGRLSVLHTEISSIEKFSGDVAEKYRQKLQSRLDELFSRSVENEERLLREVALYAERVDITEEIVRFKGHLQQFEQLVERPLERDLETRGKTLDFLLQELLREINTIGSKAADLAVSQHVVAIKSELEKIREQVQNIE
jgi:uncharacterized protein (TIGR00255 family)